MKRDDILQRREPQLAALGPRLLLVALMLLWAAHNGGYDDETWYWGGLVVLALVATTRLLLAGAPGGLKRQHVLALIAFAAYVAFSYLSIAWAQSPGDALRGSNRALLYLLVFSLLITLPWTSRTALAATLLFVVGVGLIAFVVLFRLAARDHIGSMIVEGRLITPTGYFNATAALFTMDALAAIALASYRELPALLRGLLIAIGCAGLQLGLIVQSRGWLFTLPLIALVAIVVVSERLRVVMAAVIPVLGALVGLHRLLDVYKSGTAAATAHAASQAGHIALLTCAGAFVLGTLLAWGDDIVRGPSLTQRARRGIGTSLAILALILACGAAIAATHGHPFRFISRQWSGFSHTQTSFSSGSHFADVGSGRYDFWRVSLKAFGSHPLGGLGQDNFADYYVLHRHTGEEPSWTHSLEMRLLVHTGVIGFVLFAIFLGAGVAAALQGRRSTSAARRRLAGVAMLPFVVWLIHGSVDWFWEIPALTAPALGFLAIAGAAGTPDPAHTGGVTHRGSPAVRSRPLLSSRLATAAGAFAVLGAAFVLGFPYLSVREVSAASDARKRDPRAALGDLDTAAALNPLSAIPGRLGGTIALQTGRLNEAETRFAQATAREPGGWFGWFGRGLAASTLGDTAAAQRYFKRAAAINSGQPAVREALARVLTTHPLTPAEGLSMLVLAH